MAVNYQKLWNILTEKGMTRSELREHAGITTNAMVKLGKNESVQVEILAKICCALDCTLNDIMTVEGSYTTPVNYADICIDDFVNSSQYETLGIAQIEDFPKPHTVKSLKMTLEYLCASSKLTKAACTELVEVLSAKGICIDFDVNTIPDINFIPQTFAQFEDETDENKAIVRQQLENYIGWAMQNAELAEAQLADVSKEQTKEYLVEYGYVEARIHHSTEEYAGHEMRTCNSNDIYPINLLAAIFGEGSIYIFSHRKDDIKKAVTDLLDTLLPEEKCWIKLKYEYGIAGDRLLQLLELPNYETLLWGIENSRCFNKALRKMRHPSRAKHLRDFVGIRPYGKSHPSCNLYYRWTDEIEVNIAQAILSGKTLSEALTPYYGEETISKVLSASNKWCGIPNISIDEMDLSWKSYVALEQANIRNLDQLWFAHGKHLSLKDSSKTGLKHIAGLGQQQISELLDKMGEYDLLPIESDRTAEIVSYAEWVANGNSKEPSIACNFVPHSALWCLLRLNYRRLDDVITDYVEGNLVKKVYSHVEGHDCDIKAILDMVVDCKFPTMHIETSGFWEETLKKNPQYTLESIRSAYILDKPIKCNPNELQAHIANLFPTEPTSFRLMHRTQTRTIQWISWPLSLFRKRIKKDLISKSEDAIIRKAFFAADSNENGGNWIVVELEENANKDYLYFNFGDSGLQPISSLTRHAKESIFLAIEFNAELIKKTPNIQSNVSLSFVDAQMGFCKIYGSHTAPEEDQNFFKSYTPVMVIPEARDAKLAKDITIEELNLSVRSFNCLKRANILSVADILKLSSNDFLKIKNMGKRSLVEIIGKVKKLGAPISGDVQTLFNETSAEIELREKSVNK